MSASILKERILGEIVKLLNENGRRMMNLRFQPAQTAMATVTSADGKTTSQAAVGVLPATTAEHLGMQAAELNAERHGIMEVIAIIEDQYQALVAPEEKPDALVEGKQQANGAERPEALY